MTIFFAEENPSTVTIFIPEEDPKTFAAFLQCRFEDDCKVHKDVEQTDKDGSLVIQRAKVYLFAGRLGDETLQDLALAKTREVITTASAEVRYARFVYENTEEGEKVLRKDVAMTWAHRGDVLRNEVPAEAKKLLLDFQGWELMFLR